MVGPTDLGPPTLGGLVDLLDRGLERGMAGEMGDRPGLREAADTDIGGSWRCEAEPWCGPEPGLKEVLNLKLSGMIKGGSRCEGRAEEGSGANLELDNMRVWSK